MKGSAALNFKIDQEFAEVLPTTEQRYKDLEDAVLKDGFFTDPFITWNGFLIDGHTRYRIMQNHPELDLKPYEKKMDGEFADRYAVIVWIATHQLSRRNLDLNGFEWAEVHKKAYDAEKKSVGGNRGNQYTKVAKFESELSQSEEEPRSHAGETATILADKFGMKSPSAFKHSVRTANAMDEGEKIVPGFKEGLKSGAIKASKDSVESILNIKDEDEKKAYVTAIANGEKPTNPRKAKQPRPMSPQMKDFTKKLADVVAEMETVGKPYSLDDAIRDLNSAEDMFINQVEFVLEERKGVIAADKRGKEQVIGFIESVINDLNEMKGRFI